MITKTVSLPAGSGTVTATQLLGPLDAPYDIHLTVFGGAANGPAFAGVSFSLTSGASNGGSWWTVEDSSEHVLRLQEGDSLYGAVWGSTAFANVSIFGNPI